MGMGLGRGALWGLIVLAGGGLLWPLRGSATLPDPGRTRLVLPHQDLAEATVVEDATEADRLFQGGLSLYQRGRFPAAIREWKGALQRFRLEGDRHGEADTLSNLGLAYEAQGEYRQALTHHELALALHLILGDHLDEAAQDLENAAIAYYALADYRQALRSQQQALALRQQQGKTHPRLATTLRILGQIYQVRGQYVPAIQVQQEALVLAGLRGDQREMMLSLGGLGRAFQKLGQLETAGDWYRRALAISRRLGDRSVEIKVLNDLGSSYLRLGSLDQALATYEESLALQQSGGSDRGGAASALGNVGTVQAAAGDFKQATTAYQQGLELVRQSGDRQGEAASLADLGLVQAKRGDYRGAIEFYLRALQINRQIGDRVQEATTLTRLGQVLLESKRLDEAESFLQRSADIRDVLRHELSNGDTNKTILLEEQYHTYRLLQQILVARDRPEAALEMADRARSQSLVDYLVESDAEEIQDQSPLSIAAIRQLARAEQATLVIYSNLTDTQLLAWVVSPQGTVTLHSINPSTLGLAASTVTDQARFDASSSLGEAIALWANDIRSTTVQTTAIAPSRPQPIPRTGRLSTGLQDGHRLLIAPLEAALPRHPGAKLIIVPDRELALIPFGALEDEAGVPLVDRFSIALTPSLKALTALKLRGATRIQSEQDDMVIGNPTPMPAGLSNLPGAEQEAIAVAALRNISPLLRKQATEAIVKEQYANARWLHFATHGMFNDNGGNDLSSWLALAPLGDREDGLLSMGEVFNSRLQADMVVLSACDTGQGRVTGEGIIGLARAFLKAGGSSVIATLWKVPDEPTAVLMENFYQSLAAGQGKAEALRTAIQATRSQYPHPRNWAAFVLMGDS